MGQVPETPDEQEETPVEETPAEEPAEETPAEEPAADELPELTEAQLTKLAQNPDLQKLVLGQETSQKTIEQLVEEALGQADEEKQSVAQLEAQHKTFEEAVQAAKDGDPAPLSSLIVEQYDRAQRVSEVSSELEREIQQDILFNLVQDFKDEVESLTADEQGAFDKLDSLPIAGRIAGAAKLLAEKRAQGTISGVRKDAEESRKAAQNAANAEKARADGTPNLPGGAPKENQVGVSFSDLLRQGIEDGAPSEVSQLQM